MFEIEKQRQIDTEREIIRQKVSSALLEEFRFKELEKEKIINDLKKALEVAQLKANRSSQQLQGEILELDLENTLGQFFPNDEIIAVSKGVNGADIKQIVKSPKGRPCGVILWEAKRTKLWNESWLAKLKEDLRNEKADISALVTIAMPKDIVCGMGVKEKVWICEYSLLVPLATLLRKSILDSSYQKIVAEHRGRKADLLYDYLTSHEFIQQIEALAEVYTDMQTQINRERAALEKSWKQREAQMKRLFMSTTAIYGSIQGLAGNTVVPVVRGLEIAELGDGQ